MTYKEKAGQESLIAETKLKSVRTFITGLHNSFMRTTLYGNSPKSLAEAFAIAQTVYFDNQQMKVDKRSNERTRPRQSFTNEVQKFNPNFTYEKQGKTFESTNVPQKPFLSFPQHQEREKPTPMDIDQSMRSSKPAQERQTSDKSAKFAFLLRETSLPQKIMPKKFSTEASTSSSAFLGV